MKFTYKINNNNYEINFCPDREGLKISNKKKILYANNQGS